jgi:hypothetical protein
MNVQRAKAARLEQSLRQKQTVSGDDERVRTQRSDVLELGRVFQAIGLEDRDALRDRETLHRTRRAAQAATGRAVGPREHQHDLVPRVGKRRQSSLSELGRAGED